MHKLKNASQKLSQALKIIWSQWQITQKCFKKTYILKKITLRSYLNWNTPRGLSLSIRVWRFASLLVWGGRVSSILLERSRNNKSVSCTNKEGGMLSILQYQSHNSKFNLYNKKKYKWALTSTYFSYLCTKFEKIIVSAWGLIVLFIAYDTHKR